MGIQTGNINFHHELEIQYEDGYHHQDTADKKAQEVIVTQG